MQSAVNAASQREPVTPSVTNVFSDYDTHEYVDYPKVAYPNTRYFENTRGFGRAHLLPVVRLVANGVHGLLLTPTASARRPS